jgi:mannose-6-phosphate isomerase-like protein (cupin superfamily)
MKPIALQPGDGEALSVAGNEIVFKAGATDTGGAFGFLEYTAAPEFPGPPAHIHHEMVEAFYVLEGELTMLLGDETVKAQAGSFVLVPPGTPHTFSNPGAEPVRFIGVFTPGGFEQYFKDLAALLAGGPLDPAAAAQLASAYDVQNV